MNYKTILVVFFILVLTSCSSDDNGQIAPCVDVKYGVEPTSFYGCNFYETDLLPDTYVVIRSQDELDTFIQDACIIPFYQRDLVVGKKQLQKQFESMDYDLTKDCETNNYKLIVTFKTGTHVQTETVSYSGVIPKMQPGETITVETIVL